MENIFLHLCFSDHADPCAVVAHRMAIPFVFYGGGREALAPHESQGGRIQTQTPASKAFCMAVSTVSASNRSASREGYGRIPDREQKPEAI